jgi:hypothetical protein
MRTVRQWAGRDRHKQRRQERFMVWLRRLHTTLFPPTRVQAEQRVIAAERALAKLREKVRLLPPEQRPAFTKQINAWTRRQAEAYRVLGDLLDNRRDR